MIRYVTALAVRLKGAFEAARRRRWMERLREHGMRIGEDVLLPPDTFIDLAGCHLITIGNSSSISPDVMFITRDDSAAPFLGAAKVGPIVLHESCHIGARTVLLPGIEIGPRTIVAACSVVSRSLPPDSVCAGNPARAVSSIDRYLESHRSRLAAAAMFPYAAYGRVEELAPGQRAELIAAAARGDAYITGGRSQELRGTGGSARTPSHHHVPVPPEALPAAGEAGTAGRSASASQ